MTNLPEIKPLSKKNLLSIFLLGSEVRQFVHSGLFSSLLDSGWSITVMSKVVDEDIRSQLPSEVALIPLINNPHSFQATEIPRILDKAFALRQNRQGKSTWQFGKTSANNWRQNLLYGMENVVSWILTYSSRIMKLVENLERRSFLKLDRSRWKDYFKLHPTDLLLVNVPRSTYWDPLLATTAELGIKSVLLYHTSKDIIANGRLNHNFSRIGVWNYDMKAKLIENNRWVNQSQVHLVGCGHFDCVGRKDQLISESIFRKQIGADLESILLLYPTSGPGIVPEEERYIALVVDAVERIERIIDRKIQIIFRMNPMDDREVLRSLLNEKYPQHVTWKPDWVYSRKQNWCYAHQSDPTLYNAALFYSSLCITIPSTINVDCALADLPIINLGIEVPGSQPLSGSLRSFWDVDFNRNVRETRAARVVTNVAQLEQSIDGYLADKSLDREKRKALVELELNNIFPGQSTQKSLAMINSSFAC